MLLIISYHGSFIDDNDIKLQDLAPQLRNLPTIKQILDDIDTQMLDDLDTEVAEIRASVVNELNELGETALFTAADKGYLEVVKELLKYSSKESTARKTWSGFDPLHIAALQGHHGKYKGFMADYKGGVWHLKLYFLGKLNQG